MFHWESGGCTGLTRYNFPFDYADAALRAGGLSEKPGWGIR
jgi:hypothetical protein